MLTQNLVVEKLGTEREVEVRQHTGLPSALETSSSFGQVWIQGEKRQGKRVGDKFRVKNFV
jgi:hypothetical protein